MTDPTPLTPDQEAVRLVMTDREEWDALRRLVSTAESATVYHYPEPGIPYSTTAIPAGIIAALMDALDAERAVRPQPEPTVQASVQDGSTVAQQSRPQPESDDAEYMCPNCVTPWKCNGPHVPEEQPESGDPEALLEREIARWHRAMEADVQSVTLAQHVVRVLAAAGVHVEADAGLREALIHAARDLDGAWDAEDDQPILWFAEAGEVLADLRTAVIAYDAAVPREPVTRERSRTHE